MRIVEHYPVQIQNKIIQQIYSAQQEQIDKLQTNVFDLISQFNIKTATWSLSLWEKEYGLSIREDLTIEERRGRLLAKKRARGVFNENMVKDIAESFGSNLYGFEEFPELYRFNMVFCDDNMGVKLKLFKQAIDTYKPAHLNYDITLETDNYIEIGTSEKSYDVVNLEHELYDDIYVADIDIDDETIAYIDTDVDTYNYDVINEESELGDDVYNDN